jgi:hypothetical protein
MTQEAGDQNIIVPIALDYNCPNSNQRPPQQQF